MTASLGSCSPSQLPTTQPGTACPCATRGHHGRVAPCGVEERLSMSHRRGRRPLAHHQSPPGAVGSRGVAVGGPPTSVWRLTTRMPRWGGGVRGRRARTRTATSGTPRRPRMVRGPRHGPRHRARSGSAPGRPDRPTVMSWPSRRRRLRRHGLLQRLLVASVTIRTEFFKPEKGRYLHPDENRAITHFEASRLQGFPDDYRWVGSKTDIPRQIGNAVPIALGAALGGAVRNALDSVPAAPQAYAQVIEGPRTTEGSGDRAVQRPEIIPFRQC
jgi:site-specific DNA-cytosine methylase